MKNVIFSLIIISVLSIRSYGQASMSLADKIEVEVSINNEVLYIHKIKKNQTIYGLAKYFKIPVQDLMFVNNLKKGQVIALDSEIKVPIDVSKIQTSDIKRSPNWIPLVYKVKRGETLYSIAKKYFTQGIDQLIIRNNIQSFVINHDQELVVGWWGPNIAVKEETITDDKAADKIKIVQANPIVVEYSVSEENSLGKPSTASDDDINQKYKDATIQTAGKTTDKLNKKSEHNNDADLLKLLEGVLSSKDSNPNNDSLTMDKYIEPIDSLYASIDSTLSMEVDTPMVSIKTITKEGIGLWDKEDPDNTNLFVMHRTAKINSIVKLYNPVTESTLTARVIGHIIDALYPSDIDIIVTRGVANKLGARDTRFKIEMQYYEQG